MQVPPRGRPAHAPQVQHLAHPQAHPALRFSQAPRQANPSRNTLVDPADRLVVLCCIVAAVLLPLVLTLEGGAA